MTVRTLAYGTVGYGRAPYGGYRPTNPPVPDAGQGFPGLVSNDRYEVIVLTASGEDNHTPKLRYWMGGSPEWGGLIGAHMPSLLPKWYATDEHGAPVPGVVELPAIAIPNGQEATVSGVLVEFTPRPSLITTFDGGLEPDDELGFTVYVEGFVMPGVTLGAGLVPRRSGILRSNEVRFSMRADEVAEVSWPNRMAEYLECRIGEHVRSVRVGIKNIHHVSIRSVALAGNPQPSRLG